MNKETKSPETIWFYTFNKSVTKGYIIFVLNDTFKMPKYLILHLMWEVYLLSSKAKGFNNHFSVWFGNLELRSLS